MNPEHVGAILPFLSVGIFIGLALIHFPRKNFGDSDMRLWKSIFYLLCAILSVLIWIGVK